VSAACSIGDVLLQPERLSHAVAADGEQALLDDLLTSIARVVADEAAGGTMAQELMAALEAVGPRLIARAGDGLERALGRLEDVVRPLQALFEQLIAVFELDDAGAIVDTLLGLLGSLAETTAELSIEGLRDHVATLLSVLEEDLGLTPQALDEELWALADDAIGRLEAVVDGLDPSLAANRLVVAGTLRRIRRSGREVMRFPALDADMLAAALFEEIEKLLGPTLKRAACVGHVSGDVIAAVTALKHAVPFTGFGSRTLGAGDGAPEAAQREYKWYASWLLADADTPFWQVWRIPFRADVWVDLSGESPRTMFRDKPLWLVADLPVLVLSHRRAACGTKPETWAGLVIPGADKRTYSFARSDPQLMERVAYNSAWCADIVEAMLHIWLPFSPWAQLDPSRVPIVKGTGVSATDLMDIAVSVAHCAVKQTSGSTLSFRIAPGKLGRLGGGLAPTLAAHLLGSLQALHTQASVGDGAKMWIAMLVPADLANYLGASSFSTMLREATLSLLTLRNYEGSPNGNGSDNQRHTGGLLAIFQLATSISMVKCVIAAENYGIPRRTDPVPNFRRTIWLEYFLGYGTLFGVVSGFMGTLLTWAIASIGGPPGTSARELGENVASCVVKSLALFFPNLIIWKEGDTDGGRMNLEAGGAFDGYPDQATSQYLLPWNAHDTYMCGQGNLGFFSHNATNPARPQTYAYDFMLDQGTEILAVRGGLVIDYFDWVPNGTGASVTGPAQTTSPPPPPGEVSLIAGQTARDSWNFIAIRQDPDAQDKGPGGGQVVTTAVYGHGLQSGVRSVFAARDPTVLPRAIIGTRVKRGQPIMLADSTGNSLCNHVHVEVRMNNSPAVPLARASLGLTIPFVFADGGQPQSRQWLVSDNKRDPPLPPGEILETEPPPAPGDPRD
jgi:hypothetical protein